MTISFTTPKKFWRGNPSLFVLTEKGLTVHIDNKERNGFTRCGRPWEDQADADDVLYFGVCRRCSGKDVAL